MKEYQEAKLMGELHLFLSSWVKQLPEETVLDYNKRMVDLTDKLRILFIKYEELIYGKN